MSKDFDGQREGERVVCVFRRHFLTTFRGFIWFLVVGGLSVVPVVVWGGRMMLASIVGAGLAVAGWGYAWILWYFSVYIVTSERLRQINQKGMFRKSVVEVSLERIESMTYRVPGIGGGVLGYGTILIQTAVGDMTISMVRRPEEVYNELQNVVAKANNRGEK